MIHRINAALVFALCLAFTAPSAVRAESGALSPIVGDGVELGIREYSETARKRPVDKSVTRLSERKGPVSTTDHAKLKELQGPFTNGPEVTKVCLVCHNKAGAQFIHNKHWTWSYHHPVTGQ